LGQVLSCLIGVLFNCFVVAGGIARSAVNAESGAQTQLAGCITATFMIIALFSITSFFYYIPMTVLSAVIEVSIISMIDFQAMIQAYRIDKRDCFVMVSTFLCTFFLGVTTGLFMGIGISLLIVTKTTAFPYIAILGRLPLERTAISPTKNEDRSSNTRSTNLTSDFTNNNVNINSKTDDLRSEPVNEASTVRPHHYCDIKRYHEAEEISGFCIIRMDASLYFANCAYFKSFIVHHIQATSRTFHTLVIDASAWIDIDLMGIQTLFELKEEIAKKYGIKLVLASVKGRLRDRLKRKLRNSLHVSTKDEANNSSESESQLVYMTIDDALDQRKPRLSIGSYEEQQKLLSDDIESFFLQTTVGFFG
jgi:SulP family sulfate permease